MSPRFTNFNLNIFFVIYYIYFYIVYNLFCAQHICQRGNYWIDQLCYVYCWWALDQQTRIYTCHKWTRRVQSQIDWVEKQACVFSIGMHISFFFIKKCLCSGNCSWCTAMTDFLRYSSWHRRFVSMYKCPDFFFSCINYAGTYGRS
jgi:hypothetical protein